MKSIFTLMNSIQVYNVLPSISAITGISPQRYLWRISIALHIGPRFVIASVYHSYYRKILETIEDVSEKFVASRLLNLCYWLNIAEIAALCGVTYISNRENYGKYLEHNHIITGFFTEVFTHTFLSELAYF